MANEYKKITFSIVSHGQGHLIKNFLNDLARVDLGSFEIVLTFNVVENENFLEEFIDLPIKIIRNKKIKGFGENHNAAFGISSGELFVVVNPDIRLNEFNYEDVFDFLKGDAAIGACAPIVMSSDGKIQDSARIFPTVMLLGKRIFKRLLGLKNYSDYQISNGPVKVDWLAGMFIFFKREAFLSVNGFDERYFMYYEDADICRRMQNAGWGVFIYPTLSVIHDAQRTSWKKFNFFKWHVRSIIRILFE